MKKIMVGAAVMVAALGLAPVVPVSAGTTAGTLEITPDPVEQGGTVVITNADDDSSTCEEEDLRPEAAPSETSQIEIQIEDPDGGELLDEVVIPDTDGNWSLEVTDLETLGVYTVWAQCEFSIKPVGFDAANTPFFAYPVATFEVIAQQATTTTAAPTTTVAPTTTTAATAAVSATPAYTG